MSVSCPRCQGNQTVRAGTAPRQSAPPAQRYWCRNCNRRFNDRTGTPMARLRTPVERVERSLKMRTEGLGVRASARVESVSPASIILWEQRLADHSSAWSPPAPDRAEITVEGDEAYTKVGRNRPSSKVRGGL